MINLKEIKPQYEFGNPNEDVILAGDEPAKITCGKKHYTGNGKAILSLGRKPDISFSIPLPMSTPKEYFQSIKDSFNEDSVVGQNACLELSNRVIQRNGFINSLGGGRISVVPEENKSPIISWHSQSEPFIALGSSETRIDHLVFHLFNCPEVLHIGTPNRSHREETNDGGVHSIGTVILEWKEWTIEIKSTPKTSKNLKYVKENGHFGLTHIGLIRKKDESEFLIKEISSLREAFSRFLDFAVGRLCWPNLCMGYKDNRKVYEDWGALFSSLEQTNTWAWGPVAGQLNGVALEQAFPPFMNAWCDKQMKMALRHGISLYTSATIPGRPLIDQCLVLVQTAIELLAYEYAVNQKKLIHKTGFKDLRASDEFRILFSSLGIQLEIPSYLSSLSKIAKTLQWEDIPHCLTDMRNAIAHPEHRKKGKFDDAYYDAWRLALECLELSILGMCGYNGKYQSRTSEKYIDVPWQY